MKNNETLEQRIRRVAASMDDRGVRKFFDIVPHSVFVDWDATWDEGARDDINDDSTDEELENAILSQEDSHDEYYHDKMVDYKAERAIPVVADALATAMSAQFPIEGERMSSEDVKRAREIATELLSDDRKFEKAAEMDLRKAFLFEVTDNDIKAIEPSWRHAFSNVWFRMRGKQVHKSLRTDVKKCLNNATLAWSC
jgi:hypothetical protein